MVGETGPLMSIEYRDSEENISGYLVIDRLVRGVSAGGLRVQPGLTVQEVAQLARNMTLKQAVAGIHVGGAKAGLDMPPDLPARHAVMHRFLNVLKPMILHCYSCGPDMNTSMAELDAIAVELGIPSLKIAVGRSRGIADGEFVRRYALLSQAVEGGTVNDLRPATAVEAATQTLLGYLNAPRTVALQGAGTVGGATAQLLAAAGVAIVGWADDQKCLIDESGLDVADLLASRVCGRLQPSSDTCVRPSRDILSVPCGGLVLAAISGAMRMEHVGQVAARGIVEAANLALSVDVEEALHAAGILVVPDLIAGVGGSLAVEALYNSDARDGTEVLRHVERRAAGLARRVLVESRATGLPPRRIALAWAEGRLSDMALG